MQLWQNFPQVLYIYYKYVRHGINGNEETIHKRNLPTRTLIPVILLVTSDTTSKMLSFMIQVEAKKKKICCDEAIYKTVITHTRRENSRDLKDARGKHVFHIVNTKAPTYKGKC